MAWRRTVVSVGVMATAGVAIVATLSARRAQAAFDLEVVFDGGYIYNLAGDKLVEVKTLAKGAHPMRVRIEKGSPDVGINEFRLSGATLDLWPDGTAPTRVMPKLPPNNPGQTGCDSAVDQKNPNNLLFLPNLKEAADGMGTRMKRNPKPARAGSVILTGGGEIAIREVAGCVEYRGPDDTTVYGTKRSMASGIEGVVYRWRVPAARTLTLRIAPDMGSPLTVVVTPDGGSIRLHVGSFEAATMRTGPYKIAHFTSFDDAFESIAANKRLNLWWVAGYQKSPGIDCPSGGDPEPWP